MRVTLIAPLRVLPLLFLSCTGILWGQASTPQPTPSGTLGSQPVAPVPVPTPAPAHRPRFVPVLVSVTGNGGGPVTGLTKEQFTIVDSNQATQPLQVYKASDMPLHLGVVLLCSSASFSQQQGAAVDLVQKVIRSNVDQAFVAAARGKRAWPSDRLELKRDPQELAKIIQDLDRNAGLPDAFNFDISTAETGSDENAGRSSLQTYSGGGITVFDAIYAMMNSDARPSRRVIVIFREPWAHSPGFGNRVNRTVEGQLQRIIAVAQELHVATFVIGLEDQRFNGLTDNTLGKVYTSLHTGDGGETGSASREYDQQLERDRLHAYDAGRINIQRLASETGGKTYWSTKKNYSDAVNSIANQLAGQYVVVFEPSDVLGPEHTLKITANGGLVLAQATFFFQRGK